MNSIQFRVSALCHLNASARGYLEAMPSALTPLTRLQATQCPLLFYFVKNTPVVVVFNCLGTLDDSCSLGRSL
eukprot:scaffold12694_cov46-Attheya_sp.AAC.4